MIEFFIDSVQQLHWDVNWGEIARTLLRCDPDGDSRFLCEAAKIFTDVLDNRKLFTGSASSEVAAGLATHGYYIQERISDMITDSGRALFGLAPLLYLLSGIGGLIMLALGAPPKLYLWFLMGPGLFWVLLAPGNRVESAGNLYMIGRRIMPQDEVQRIAAIGENDFGLNFLSVTGPTGGRLLTYSDPASVSWLFALIDTAISSVIRGLEAAFTPVVTVEFPGGGKSESLWHSIANSRWNILESITSARISQADLRDLFVTFMSSECRGTLSKYLNYAAYLSARTGKIPETVFDPRINIQQNPQILLTDLANTTIPVPLSMRGLVNDVLRGTVMLNNTNPKATIGYSIFGDPNPPAFTNIFNSTQIQCSSFLHILMAAIRAEAGYQYAKIMEASPRLVFRFSEDSSNPTAGLIDGLLQPVAGGPMSALELTREIFGYWSLPGEIFNNSFTVGGFNFNFGFGGSAILNRVASMLGINSDAEQQAQQFLIDIITAHIFQNELKFMPPLVVDNGIDNREYAKAATQNIGSVGATTKFGEIYVWAKMLPQVQGIALMLLAATFPIAVVLMVMPNFHKALLTWTLFFVWVKSWDVGFTLVKRIEPVLWSFVGKSDSLAESITRTMDFSASSVVLVVCDVQRGTSLTNPGSPPCGEADIGSQTIPTIPIALVRSPEPDSTTGVLPPMGEEEALHTLDVGLSLHEAFNLAEGNAFYIYLMAALYFSVPVLLGQIILGSKAAMANILKDFTGQIASDGSRAAGQAYSAQRQAQASATAASFNQAEMLKNMREQGLAERAIQAQNLSLRNQVDSALKGQIAQGIRTQAEMASLGLEASQRLSQGLINRQLWPVIVGGNQARQAGMGAVGATSQMMWIDNLVRRVALNGEQAQPVSVEDYAQLFSDNVLNPTEAIKDTATTIIRLATADQGYQAQAVGRATRMGTSQNVTRAGNALNGSNNSLPVGDPSQGSQVSPFTAAGEARLQPHRFVTSPTGVIPDQPQPNQVTQTSGRGLDNSDGSLMADASSMTDGATPGWGRIAGAVQQQVFFYMNAAQQLYSLPRDQGISLLGAEIADRRAHATALGQSLGIESFRHSQDSAAFGQTSQRVSAAANFEAQSSTWLARANYANAVAATLSAYGVSPQTVSPGEKPTEYMGAAWLGQLGSSANDQAHYVDNNNMFGIFQEIRRDTAGLLSNYSDIRMYETFLNSRMNPDTLMGLGLTSLMSEQGMMDTQIRQKLNEIPMPKIGSNP